MLGLSDVRKGQTSRERILDIALYEASIRGIEGLTIGELAQKVGMSKSGLFAHFGSIEVLRIETIERAADYFRQEVVESVLTMEPGWDMVRGFLEKWMDWATDEKLPGGCPLASSLFAFDHPRTDATEKIAEYEEALLQFVIRIVEKGKKGDIDTAVDSEMIAHQVLGVYLQFHVQHWLMQKSGARDVALRLFNERVVR